MKINIEWRSHQVKAAAFALTQFGTPDKFAWWLMGCRTGKTLAGLKVVMDSRVQRTLVLTTKAAVDSAWKQDIDDYVTGIDYIFFGKQVTTPDGRVPKLTNAAKKASFLEDYLRKATLPIIVVINYESARLMAYNLRDCKFDLVIADESHKLKAHNSKQSQALARAFMKVPYKLLLTGTGWEDRPTDVYGQVRFMQPCKRYSSIQSCVLGTWGDFFDRYANYYLMDRVKIATGYKNIEGLQKVLAPFTLYVDSREVLDLPTEEHETVLLPMPKAMRVAYDELDEHMVLELGDDLLLPDNQLVKALRLHQITSGYAAIDEPIPLLPDSKNPKIQAMKGILDEIGGEATVIFTHFKYDVEIIGRTLKSMGISYKQLTGDVNEHEEWMRGEGQVIIVNISAGGTGISLNRARYCMYYSMGVSRTDYVQSLWRIRAQPDPSKPIYYWHLCIEDSIDVKIKSALDSKGIMSKLLLDGITQRVTR